MVFYSAPLHLTLRATLRARGTLPPKVSDAGLAFCPFQMSLPVASVRETLSAVLTTSECFFMNFENVLTMHVTRAGSINFSHFKFLPQLLSML